MICVALSERTLQQCQKDVQRFTLVELRMDLLPFGADALDTLIGKGAQTIITFRAKTNSSAENELRLATYRRAIELGATYVDLDGETTSPEMIDSLRDYSQQRNTKLILSYHNFEQTPSREELEGIIATLRARGADIVKIATTSRSLHDNATLISLLPGRGDLIVVGMGETGKMTRISAPLLGSILTFACPDEGAVTAPGQLSVTDLTTIYQTFTERGVPVSPALLQGVSRQ